MATIFTHPAVALALTPWFKGVRKSKSIIIIGALFTILPDADVISFALGIPYENMWGHRGISHSLAFAALLSTLMLWVVSFQKKLYLKQTWVFLFICMASHGVLDALTNGGLGVAFFSPFSETRYFFPIRPIEVSTLNIKYFFNGQGLAVIKNELIWIWPFVLISYIAYSIRKFVIRDS